MKKIRTEENAADVIIRDVYPNESDSEFKCGCGATRKIGKLDPANQAFNKPLYILCKVCNATYRVREHKYVTIDKVTDRDEMMGILGREFTDDYKHPNIPIPIRI